MGLSFPIYKRGMHCKNFLPVCSYLEGGSGVDVGHLLPLIAVTNAEEMCSLVVWETTNLKQGILGPFQILVTPVFFS